MRTKIAGAVLGVFLIAALASPSTANNGDSITAFSKSAIYSSAGSGQYGLTVASATTLTVPTGATIAEICVETQGVRYKDDGGTPTSSSGIPVPSGTCFQYAGPLSAIEFIQQSSSATLDVSYYK